MENHLKSLIKKDYPALGLILMAALFSLLAGITPANAQGPTAVQTLTGETGPGAGVVYNLSKLERGQTLYVYARSASGNLDPMALLTDGDANQAALRAEFAAEVQQAITAGRDPLEVIPEFSNQTFLAWDDDSGQGYDAAFAFEVPADGDYKLAVTSSPRAKRLGIFSCCWA